MALPVLPPVIEALRPNGAGPRKYNDNYIFYWNDVGLNLVRLTHTNAGPQNGPPLTARFLGILHLAVHDAYFATFPYSGRSGAMQQFTQDFKPYLSTTDLNAIQPPARLSGNAAEARDAVAGAAITVLDKLFKTPDKRDPGVSLRTASALSDFIDVSIRSYQETYHLNSNGAAFAFGAEIASLILERLEIKSGEPGVDALNYVPNSNQPYYFDSDPSHPVRLRPIDPNAPERGSKATRPYHGPFYGTSAAVFATAQDVKIADPPVVPSKPPNLATAPTTQYLEYLESVEDVNRMGGAEELATTKREPVQTANALFWAYDGTNLIGAPPRSYNQMIKQIAFDHMVGSDLNSDENNAQFVRLLALVNVAMADAGIFCWREKYKYQLWRPLSGVREDPSGPVPGGSARPFWKVLGAPDTNSNETGFKPPFPSYPSGHATFGASAFQMVRLFYDQRGDIKLLEGDRDVANDKISFTFISDELNGISRSLDQAYIPSLPIENQPGDVRTRVPFTFRSIKDAIFSNGISRIWLGVHWNFDAFAAQTVSVRYTEGSPDGKDNNLPQPNGRRQLYKVAADGSTLYQKVSDMNWFAAGSLGPRDGAGKFPVGGVPLGIRIADSIFDNKMRSSGSLVDLGNNINKRRS